MSDDIQPTLPVLSADHPAIVTARDMLVQLKGYFDARATEDNTGISKRYAGQVLNALTDLDVARGR